MLKIGDLLNRTVREDNGVKKRAVVMGVALGLCISMSFIICIFYFADIDGYLQDTKPIINLYDFYDQKVGENETAIFFIGSSIVGTGIYPPEINRILKMNYPNITAYNLYMGADLPIERTLEIQKIIDAKPSLVIIGITYRSVTDEINYDAFYERTKLVYSRLDIRDDRLSLYTEDEKMYFTQFSDLEKLKYLISAIQYKLCGHTQGMKTINYSYDPYGGEKSRLAHYKYPRDIIAAWANDPYNEACYMWHPVVTNESTRNKDALISDVKTLQDVGIPVIIINMPIHPEFSDKITDESRENLYHLLDETGAEWYDFERNYDDDYFLDQVHATFDGAMKFAPRMADLIIEQVEKDVIHYT